MENEVIEALKTLIRSVPEDSEGRRNIGATLEDAMERAGYHLEVHQGGIAGATILAVEV